MRDSGVAGGGRESLQTAARPDTRGGREGRKEDWVGGTSDGYTALRVSAWLMRSLSPTLD